MAAIDDGTQRQALEAQRQAANDKYGPWFESQRHSRQDSAAGAQSRQVASRMRALWQTVRSIRIMGLEPAPELAAIALGELVSDLVSYSGGHEMPGITCKPRAREALPELPHHPPWPNFGPFSIHSTRCS
jgi:hypothetical protein